VLDAVDEVGAQARDGAEQIERLVSDLLSFSKRLRLSLTMVAATEVMRSSLESCAEVFAPVVVLYPYSDVREAIRGADASDFGLQAGLFTHDQRIVNAALDGIEVGGLVVNDVSTFRIDHMPYGGVKMSGFGREGLRYAIEEMTEQKLVVFNNSLG